MPEGEPLLEEFLELAGSGGRAAGGPPIQTRASIQSVAGAFEPDVLLLSPGIDGRFCLRGGALCFPTGWALGEKIGRPLDFIHGVVPGLNAALGDSIHQFLSRLKPGGAVMRDNWGIAATDELNLHPVRGIPAPSTPVDLARLWLRAEHQLFLALPRSNGIAFAIRIALHRLDLVAKDAAATGLRRALETMAPEVAAYKRLEAIREPLVKLL